MNFKEEYQKRIESIESILEKYLPVQEGYQKIIMEAMEYSLMAGGKRLRPMLMKESFTLFGGEGEIIEPFMAAIEMIHTYSLVHDDLPAMDNDEYRRGRKTTHVVYGEDMGILAGDALLNMAFECFLADKNFDENTLKAVRYVGQNSGIKGMIGGQCIDLTNESKRGFTLEEVRNLNRLKTSGLIKSALVGSIIKCGATEEEVKDIETYATKVGEIFQIADDILDKTSTSSILGKDVNKDSQNDKVTVVDLMGIENARAFMLKLEGEAISAIEKYGERSKKLVDTCKYLTGRIN